MPSFVGQSVRRKEDARLVAGHGRYVADLRAAGMVEAVVLRSPQAHARLRRLDVGPALALPGVVAVFTAADLVGRVETHITRMFYKDTPPEIESYVHPLVKPYRAQLLAVEEVFRVGEPVALIVAADRYIAEDARDRISVEYEPLPVVTDAEAALRPDSPLVHPELGDNIHCRFSLGCGDVERAFATAAQTLRARLRTPRALGHPMETRAILASFEPNGRRLSVWATSQTPHLMRAYLAEMLHVAEDDIRVAVPDMGGGFGGGIYNEDILIPFAAVRLGRPVRWVADRVEDLENKSHSRNQLHEAEVAFEADGTIVGLRDRFLVDSGCYNPFALTQAFNTASHLRGQLKIDNFAVEGICVLTNKAPNSPVRGAGRPEATFVMDRLVDAVAARLGLDPVEVRRRNLIPGSAMPCDMGIFYRDGGRVVYDSGDFPAQLEAALRAVDYPVLCRQLDEWRRAGRRVGVGVSSCVEGTGFGPHEGAIVRLDPTGQVLVHTGSSPHGQSHETVLAQVCADELGVSPPEVTVRAGDTSLIPYGGGTFASRSAVTAGNAVLVAARRLREKLLAVAAGLLEARPEDLELAGGRAFLRGAPGRGLSLRELARAAAPGPGMRLPAGLEPGLEAQHYFVPQTVTYASSTHVAVVEVDEATGWVELLRYLVVHDCGRILNPQVVEGQVVGGVVHGIGNAMLEEVRYDGRGQLLTGTLMDYLLPATGELPRIDVIHQEHPTPRNPLGVKGCGEGGTTSPPAAIASAVAAALRPLDVPLLELPLTPERVLQGIEAARRAR